jgi:hypothetical protein
MAFLSPDTFIGSLEDAIITHITTRMTANSYTVVGAINKELPRKLTYPTITLTDLGHISESSGGMNIVGRSATNVIQQSKYLTFTYAVTVTTDDNTGKQTTLNKICSVLIKDCFEQHLHTLLTNVGGIDASLDGQGIYVGGHLQDTTLYERGFELTIRIIVPDDVVAI